MAQRPLFGMRILSGTVLEKEERHSDIRWIKKREPLDFDILHVCRKPGVVGLTFLVVIMHAGTFLIFQTARTE